LSGLQERVKHDSERAQWEARTGVPRKFMGDAAMEKKYPAK
jgi:hypothetical protein